MARATPMVALGYGKFVRADRVYALVPLEGEEREAFLAEYRSRAARAYPQRASGITLFPFLRLFCVATRR